MNYEKWGVLLLGLVHRKPPQSDLSVFFPSPASCRWAHVEPLADDSAVTRQKEQKAGASYLFWTLPSKTQNSSDINPQRFEVYLFQQSNSMSYCLEKRIPSEAISWAYYYLPQYIQTAPRVDKLVFTEKSCVCRWTIALTAGEIVEASAFNMSLLMAKI